MINGNRVIAVEEHFATPAFLKAAHELDVLPGDETEVGLMRQVEDAPHMRSELLDLDARAREMDAIGQDTAVLSLNPPGAQPYLPGDAVPLAREFNDTLAAIVRGHPGRFGGLGTVTPQDPEAAAAEIERVMGPLGQGVLGGDRGEQDRVAGEQAAAVPQRRGDRDAGPGWQGDQAGRVAADDYHACLGGEGQPVPAAPAQRAGDRPVGDAAGAVDVGEPVHHVPGKRGRAHGRDRERQGPGSGRRTGGTGRGRRGDDRSDQRAGHGCLPRLEAGPVSAVGRPQASAGPSARSSGVRFRGDFTGFCVRGPRPTNCTC